MFKVLLADDEYMILNGLEKLIPWEELGFEIAGKARNGKQALDFISKENVDLVISDVSMPIMNGLDFIKKAREADIDFEVIMLSGYQEFEFVREALRFGSVNYLLKPVDKKEMSDTLTQVRHQLEKRQAESRRQTYVAEYLIQKWLHNEAEQEELINFFKVSPERFDQENYTVVFIKQEEPSEAIADFFVQHRQPFVFYFSENHSWVLIYMGKDVPIRKYLSHLMDKFGFSYDMIIVGETVGSAEDVFLSYDSAQSSDTLHEFYSGDEADHELYNDIAARGSVPNVSFVKLGQALSIHDFATIEKEIDTIFTRMEQRNVAPVYARHLTFLIYIDLYRNFTISDTFYQTQAQKIIASNYFEDLHQCINDTLDEIKAGKGNRQYSPYIQKILHIIDEEYMTDVTLKDISDRLYLSSMYVGQLFKKEVKKSFSQYLNQYRINIVQKLLLETDCSITEIAVKSGYATPNYLAKNFKKICGMSPKEFRNEYAKGYVSVG